MNNYEDNILEAIETIVDSSIAKSNYDRTIQATIIKMVDLTAICLKIKLF